MEKVSVTQFLSLTEKEEILEVNELKQAVIHPTVAFLHTENGVNMPELILRG